MKFLKNLFVLSSPSGGGKSTVARHLLAKFPELRFSISATTRDIRPKEVNGKDYHFLSREEFKSRIDNGELVEYEEIFGNYYGTLRPEIDRAIDSAKGLIFDIDVKGAMSIKKLYPEESVLIFLSPPSIYTLEKRLKRRKTESEEQIKTRLSRAQMEMNMRDQFDYLIINENLPQTLGDAERIVSRFIIED